MWHSKLAGSLLVLSLPGAWLAAAAPPAPTPALAAVAPNVCKATAIKARNAARLEAFAQYHVSMANCLNDTEGDTKACKKEALAELKEALLLANEQYAGRLEVCALLGPGPYDPQLDAGEFSSVVNNDFFPLVVNRTLVYRKQTDEGLEEIVVTTLDETTSIDGFPCAVVRDVVTLDGVCVEDTIDWYSQRANGEVWYLGEIAQNFEDGLLADLGGSWMTGKDGAKPGVLMRAVPAIDDVYRQEFLINEAEDMAIVVSTNETVTVPAGTFTGCLQTEEWTPLEPDSRERKFYAPGIGLVKEVKVDSDEPPLELIEIIG